VTRERTEQAKLDFPTEADLCDCLIETWNREGWTCYPETAGFDILAVRDDTGHQCGIEAKLKLNDKVISQILPDAWPWSRSPDIGPDWRAILIPPNQGESHGIRQLLGIAGITLLVPEREHMGRRGVGWIPTNQRGKEASQYHDFRRRYIVKAKADQYELAWFDWNPTKRCVLPEYVPSVRAGVPGPIQLTPWKIGALRVMAVLEHCGWVDRHIVKECGCDPRRFCASDGWLVQGDRAGRWVRGPHLPNFDQQHPIEYAEILAKERKKIRPLISEAAA
jgi:hypothetical protein